MSAADRICTHDLHTGGTIGEILSTPAHKRGYANQAHFVRDFKAAVGRPPASHIRS
jgi:AraC-like DNA-binding protein